VLISLLTIYIPLAQRCQIWVTGETWQIDPFHPAI
jgi:hypothetical protein